MYNIYCPYGNMYPPYSPWNLVITYAFCIAIFMGGSYIMNALCSGDKFSTKKKILIAIIGLFITVTFLLNLLMWNGNPGNM